MMKYFIACIGLIILTQSAIATQWTVSSTNPFADFDNIQDAVDAASDGDEIQVFDGTYTCSSSDPSVPVVEITNKSITLLVTFGVVAIDGEGIHQGIICSGANSTIRIEGFIIQNCGGANQLGGGLYCNDNSPTIVNCSFMNNNAEARGGGMYFSTGCNPSIEGCTLVGNSAGSKGGGVYFSELCEPTIANCTVIASNAGVDGGGMYSASVSITLSNTEVCGNVPNQIVGSYTDSGGNAICDNPKLWTVDDNGPADFVDIQAAVDAASDGDEIVVMPGIYTSLQAGHVVLIFDKFLTIRSINPNDPAIVASTIIDGQDERRGIACISTTALRMHTPNANRVSTNSTRAQNKSNLNSKFATPRIHDDDTLYQTSRNSRVALGAPVIRVQGFTIINGYAAEFPYGVGDRQSISGGGILGANNNLFISNCVFSGNAGYQGGAISFMMNEDNLSTVTDCLITDNSTFNGTEMIGSSFEWSAGIFAQYGFLEISDSIFDNNISHYATGGIGGWETEFVITDCMITNNAVLEENNSYTHAGGMMMAYSKGTVANCSFIGNEGLLGGALQISDPSGDALTVRINNCLFENNTVDSNGSSGIEPLGGAVFVGVLEDSSCHFTNCEFVNNSSITGVGGGVSIGETLLNYNPKATFSNCSFQGNSAVSGGGMWIGVNGTVLIDSTTFCENTPIDIEGPWIDDGSNVFSEDCLIGCPDLNGDGIVNTAELLAIVAYWGCSNCPTIDIDENGIVDINDLLAVIDHWGPC